MVRVGYKVLYTKVVTLISLLFLQRVPKVCYVYLDSEAGAGRHALGEVRHHAAALCNQHTLDIQISGQVSPPWYCGCAASAGWSAHCASLQHRAPALQSALQCCGLTAAGSSSVTITTTVHLMLVLLLSRSVND